MDNMKITFRYVVGPLTQEFTYIILCVQEVLSICNLWVLPTILGILLQ